MAGRSGATLDQLRSAVRTDSFATLAADLARGASWPRLTLGELATVTGVPVERIQAIRVSVGQPVRVFTASHAAG